MFDKNTYSSKFLKTHDKLEKLRNEYFEAFVNGNERKQISLQPKLEKAEKDFVIEHDKYCDKYNLNSLKLKDNWSKFWSK